MRVSAALSCFQGELACVAASTLLELGFSSLQLTPGCAPSPDLDGVLAGVNVSTHHGYTPAALRQRVWHDGAVVSHSDSIHPPTADHAAWLWQADVSELPVIEVMFPGYALGSGAEFRRAMDAGMRLAVDVSHLYIQLMSGSATRQDVAALMEYDHVAEIHVSHNDGTRDSHQPLSAATYGLAWARERSDVPAVFEGYLHRLSDHQRRTQVELLADFVG